MDTTSDSTPPVETTLLEAKHEPCCDSSCPGRSWPSEGREPEPPYLPQDSLPNQAEQARHLYKPIHKWQTRIMHLAPATHYEEHIRAELHTVDLIQGEGVVIHEQQTHIHYEALSYCWGSSDCSRNIVCNGVIYPVTKNLYDALYRLRQQHDASEPQYLWFDALCTNQHDIAERSMQVQNMLVIYQKAFCVVVWLGEAGEFTEVAMSTLHSKVTGTAERIRKALRKACGWHIPMLLIGLHDLLHRPWYSRVWIKQEVWAAGTIRVMCGNGVTDWKDLAAGAMLMERIMSEKDHDKDDSALDKPGLKALITEYCPKEAVVNPFTSLHMASAETQCQVMQPDQPVSRGSLHNETEFLNVLQQNSGGAKCTNPRDYVYGVLGMSRVNRAHNRSLASTTLPVSYSRTVSQVFQDVVRYHLARDRNLAVLYLEATFGGHVGGVELPSWCPDWSQAFSISENYRDMVPSRPLVDSHIDSYGRYKLTPEGDVLLLRGYAIATVTSATKYHSEEWSAYSTEDIKFYDNQDLYNELDDLAQYYYRLHYFSRSTKAHCLSPRGPPKPADIVVLVQGGKNPLILRQLRLNEFQFVGSLVRWSWNSKSQPTRLEDAGHTALREIVPIWNLWRHLEESLHAQESFNLV